jgi:superfamily II DNA or RNA helicase
MTAFSPEAVDLNAPGLREAQRGALHAVAAHRAASSAPAQVVLPTGVGKTLIATLLPYVLGAKQVLVVTPARIVRDQVAHSFKTLTVAKEVGALDKEIESPSLVRADHRCDSEFWQAHQDSQVVVGNPMVLSHGYAGVEPIPEGRFDLVIFDEAHHLPAPTWTILHEHLSTVSSVLLTATPFRADRQRLPGEIAFAYPLRRAIAQGAYQPVGFVPVQEVDPADRDQLLAEKVAERLADPKHMEVESRALIRTDRKEHADALVGVYAEQGLEVAPVLDRTSGQTVRRLLKKLDDGTLHGLVVVGAMTEGFDFPRMKVAAYHRPHKSLAPTLQFIGRLARSGDVNGELIAFPADVSGETSELFREDAAWETLLPDIVDSAVEGERVVRQFTSGLSAIHHGPTEVSALVLAPGRSSHIFRTTSKLNLSFDPEHLGKGDVTERFHHPQHDLLAYITRHRLHPRFMREDALDSVEYRLHIATWIEDPGLLFISTDSAAALKTLCEELVDGYPAPIGAQDLARLLAAAELERCFSVGARTATAGTATNESYRTLSGRRAELSLSPSDARARVLGHVMGRMSGEGAGSGTFGFSAKKSKLWEPTATESLIDFREWCLGHASVLKAASAPEARDSPLKYLSIPDTLSAYPDAATMAVLPFEFLSDPRILRIGGKEADPIATDVACERLSAEAVELTVSYEGESCTLRVGLDGQAEIVSGSCLFVDPANGEAETIDELLSEHPVPLIFGDGSLILGPQRVRPAATPAPLPGKCRAPIDWGETEIGVEFGDPAPAPNSIAARTIALLEAEADAVVQDHLPYELADFLCISLEGDQVSVDVVHCKAAGGAQPGRRVIDIQELLAQAMRSVYFATAGAEIWVELRRRLAERASTRVIKGEEGALAAQLEAWAEAKPLINWRLTVVQPGVADDQLDSWPQGNALFGAAYDTCQNLGIEFRLIDSAG